MLKPPVPHFGKSAKKDPQQLTQRDKYTNDTPMIQIREAMIQDGLKHGGNKDFVIGSVDATLKKAKDPDVFKGLVAYLNWQDKLRGRVQTPKAIRQTKSAVGQRTT